MGDSTGGVNGDLMVFNGILLLFNGVFCDIYIKLLNSDFMGGLMVILWDSMGFYEIWMGYQGDINGIWWSDGALMRLNDDSLMAPVFSPGTQVGRWCPQWRTPLAYAGNWPGSLSAEIAKKNVQKLDSWPHRKNGSENDRESIAGSKNWGLLMFVQEFCLWVLYKNNFRLETWW